MLFFLHKANNNFDFDLDIIGILNFLSCYQMKFWHQCNAGKQSTRVEHILVPGYRLSNVIKDYERTIKKVLNVKSETINVKKEGKKLLSFIVCN